MKAFSILMCVCLMFSSCFSYRTINLSENQLVLNKYYKIKTNAVKKITGKISEVNDSTLVLVDYKKDKANIHLYKVETKIPLSEIQEIKKRKFSYLKTIGIPIGILGLIVFLAIAIGGGIYLY